MAFSQRMRESVGVSTFSLLLCIFIITHKASAFTFPSLPPAENQQIPILGSTVNIKGITDQTNKVFINSREINVLKDGTFQEEVIVPLGETEVIVAVVDKAGNRKEYQKKIQAKEKYFFLVGIADGTLNVVDASNNLEWTRDNSSFKKGTHLDGKISYYFAGKIKGKYLIKSSLDTDKSTQEKLFSNIDPNKYYPIYGDNSTVVYDVNSQGKFYLLLEWDKSGFTFGNYQTQFDDAQLAQYNRTLYGGKVHLETRSRTAYGDPKSKLTAFVAEANQYAGHSEFLATGGSLYYLRHRDIIEGSEKVTIIVRDKNNGIMLYSLPQEENVDYEIKYDEGRVLFKKPVLSVASSDSIISNSILEGNPVYISVNYEYKSQEAFPITTEDLDKKTGGIRLSQALGNHIQLGATYVQESKDAKNFRLYGQDASIKIGSFTKLSAEFAQSRAESIPNFVSYNGGFDFTKVSQENNIKASAHKFSLETSLGEYLGLGRDCLAISGYYQNIANNFSPLDTLFESGVEKYGLGLSHKITDNDTVKLSAQKEVLLDEALNQAAENQLTARRTQTYNAQWMRTQNKWTLTSEYQERQKTESLSFYDRPLRERIAAERIGYQLSKNTSVFVGQQVSLSGYSNNQSQVGFTTKIDNTQVQTHAGFGNAGNSVLLGLEKSLNEYTSSYMNYSLINSRIDGKSSITSFGSRTLVGKGAKLRTERQFITSDQRGLYSTNLMGIEHELTPRFSYGLTYQRQEEQPDPNLIASFPRDSVSVNTAYAKPDKLKMENKFEFREDTDNSEQYLTDNSAELKLTQDFFLFGEYDYSVTKKPGNATYARLDVKHVGLAFRPVDYDWFNWLFKYIRLTDERPEGLNNADGGFVKMNTISDVYATEFAFDLPFHFQFVEKFSYKDERTVSYDMLGIIKTPENLKAQLFIHRLNYHLTKLWDIAAEYRILKERVTQGIPKETLEDGILFEVARKILNNLYIGVGCNFTSFTDDLTEKKEESARGFFLRIQGRY